MPCSHVSICVCIMCILCIYIMISDVCGSKYSRIYSGKSGGAMWYMAPPLYIEEGSGGPTGYPVSLGL